ncbi:MAG: DUF2520 domain-containing protein [Bacteroidetes bacterium]|nr:MAG: DUF2520 domain-containing protein [Bacteroidota bacterium]
MNWKGITLVGAGNVAYHLARHFQGLSELSFLHIWSRKQEKAQFIAQECGAKSLKQLSEIPADSLVILCVSDEAIDDVLEQLPSHLPVAYTSGSVQLQTLPHRDFLGVFYPLQSFTKGIELSEAHFPVLIEANQKTFEQELLELAAKISPLIRLANSEQRREIHLSAVFANNFSNYMWQLAQKQLQHPERDWELLLPLIRESVHKLNYQTPYQTQTGPARRGDQETIAAHLKELNQGDREIYRLLSDRIWQLYHQQKENDEL